jgi:Uncharacterised BCR, YnfA/UPF0060 family
MAAALAEIGGAYLVWVGLRDDKGLLVAALGVLALGPYGVVATLQPENEFGRVLAAYGGVFIVGSIVRPGGGAPARRSWLWRLTQELGLTFLHTAAYDSANDVDVGFDAVERGVALRD